MQLEPGLVGRYSSSVCLHPLPSLRRTGSKKIFRPPQSPDPWLEPQRVQQVHRAVRHEMACRHVINFPDIQFFSSPSFNFFKNLTLIFSIFSSFFIFFSEELKIKKLEPNEFWNYTFRFFEAYESANQRASFYRFRNQFEVFWKIKIS